MFWEHFTLLFFTRLEIMIETTELLEFLTKAQKLSPSGVTFQQMDEGYKIT
jgi:hypothetical protein